MNKHEVVGNLTKEPTVRYTKAGTAVAEFTVAASNEFKNADGTWNTSFIKVVAWDKLSDIVAPLSKGARVIVLGRVQTRSYEAQDGSKRYVTETVATTIGVIPKNSGDGESNFDDFAGGGSKEEIPF